MQPVRDLPINVRLSMADIATLTEIASELGYSRSELLRLIVRRGLPYARDFPRKDRAAAIQPVKRRGSTAAEGHHLIPPSLR